MALIELENSLNFKYRYNEFEKMRDVTEMGLGQSIGFCHGKIDDWCAICFLTHDGDNPRCAMATDAYYFEIALRLSQDERYGPIKVYKDIKSIFDDCTKELDPAMIQRIQDMAEAYGENREYALNMFYHLYYGMVAEENKKGTKIGRLIKMLGIYDLLIEEKGIKYATNRYKRVFWLFIQDEAFARDIYRPEDRDAYMTFISAQFDEEALERIQQKKEAVAG